MQSLVFSLVYYFLHYLQIIFQQVIHYNKETKIKKLNCTGREKENVRSDQSS